VISSVIALAADHAGFVLKNSMKVVLEEHSFPLVDLGPETADPVDYTDMAGKLAAALKEGRAQQGLLVCGSGIGIAIAANRYPLGPGRHVSRRHGGAPGARTQRRQRSCPWRAPDRARGCARLSVDLSQDAIYRGSPRAACGQNVGARAIACVPNP
jgi:hypothetical protein